MENFQEVTKKKMALLTTKVPLGTQTHVVLLSRQGVAEFKFKSIRRERSVLQWEVRSVGFRGLAHVSSKHHLLLMAPSSE